MKKYKFETDHEILTNPRVEDIDEVITTFEDYVVDTLRHDQLQKMPGWWLEN